MITCVYVSHVRTTWSASAFSASTAPLPLSPPHPHCSGPSIPSRGYAAAALPDLQEITARLKLTCVTQTPAWTEECALAEREATPASAGRIIQVRMWLCVSGRRMRYCVFLDDGKSCKDLQKNVLCTLQLTLAKNRPLMAGSPCQNRRQHFKCVLKLAVGCTVEWWK